MAACSALNFEINWAVTVQSCSVFREVHSIGWLPVLSVLPLASHGCAAESSQEFAPLLRGVHLHSVQSLAVESAQDASFVADSDWQFSMGGDCPYSRHLISIL